MQQSINIIFNILQNSICSIRFYWDPIIWIRILYLPFRFRFFVLCYFFRTYIIYYIASPRYPWRRLYITIFNPYSAYWSFVLSTNRFKPRACTKTKLYRVVQASVRFSREKKQHTFAINAYTAHLYEYCCIIYYNIMQISLWRCIVTIFWSKWQRSYKLYYKSPIYIKLLPFWVPIIL